MLLVGVVTEVSVGCYVWYFNPTFEETVFMLAFMPLVLITAAAISWLFGNRPVNKRRFRINGNRPHPLDVEIETRRRPTRKPQKPPAPFADRMAKFTGRKSDDSQHETFVSQMPFWSVRNLLNWSGPKPIWYVRQLLSRLMWRTKA